MHCIPKQSHRREQSVPTPLYARCRSSALRCLPTHQHTIVDDNRLSNQTPTLGGSAQRAYDNQRQSQQPSWPCACLSPQLLCSSGALLRVKPHPEQFPLHTSNPGGSCMHVPCLGEAVRARSCVAIWPTRLPPLRSVHPSCDVDSSAMLLH